MFQKYRAASWKAALEEESPPWDGGPHEYGRRPSGQGMAEWTPSQCAQRSVTGSEVFLGRQEAHGTGREQGADLAGIPGSDASSGKKGRAP